MKTIYKYQISIVPINVVELPRGSKILHAGMDPNGQPCIWAAVDDSGGEIRARFSGGRPYVLHLGTLEPRKGLLDLVAAWEMVSNHTSRHQGLQFMNMV